MKRDQPTTPDEWLDEIRLAIADARKTKPFGILTGQRIKDGNLFHLAPLVCLKFRGLDYRDEELRGKVTEGALANYVANSDPDGTDHGLESRSLLAFAVIRTPDVGMDLTVHPVGSDHELHRFGFCQPVADSPVVPLTEIAVVLVPGLAFDMTGNRLGHGAGYYDRFLANLRRDVVRVGVSDGFIVSALPVDAHDVAMTHLAGDMGVVAL